MRITDYVFLNEDRVPVKEWEGIDPRLRNIIIKTAEVTGIPVEVRSGKERRDGGFHPSGRAIDIWLINPETGERVPHGAGGISKASNRGAATGFNFYENFAKVARNVQQQMYPELEKAFRWGGYFSGSPSKYGSLDTMQFDIGGSRDLGMAGGSWETGLYPQQRRLWENAGYTIGGPNPNIDIDHTRLTSIRSDDQSLGPWADSYAMSSAPSSASGPTYGNTFPEAVFNRLLGRPMTETGQPRAQPRADNNNFVSNIVDSIANSDNKIGRQRALAMLEGSSPAAAAYAAQQDFFKTGMGTGQDVPLPMQRPQQPQMQGPPPPADVAPPGIGPQGGPPTGIPTGTGGVPPGIGPTGGPSTGIPTPPQRPPNMPSGYNPEGFFRRTDDPLTGGLNNIHRSLRGMPPNPPRQTEVPVAAGQGKGPQDQAMAGLLNSIVPSAGGELTPDKLVEEYIAAMNEASEPQPLYQDRLFGKFTPAIMGMGTALAQIGQGQPVDLSKVAEQEAAMRERHARARALAIQQAKMRYEARMQALQAQQTEARRQQALDILGNIPGMGTGMGTGMGGQPGMGGAGGGMMPTPGMGGQQSPSDSMLLDPTYMSQQGEAMEQQPSQQGGMQDGMQGGMGGAMPGMQMPPIIDPVQRQLLAAEIAGAANPDIGIITDAYEQGLDRQTQWRDQNLRSADNMRRYMLDLAEWKAEREDKAREITSAQGQRRLNYDYVVNGLIPTAASHQLDIRPALQFLQGLEEQELTDTMVDRLEGMLSVPEELRSAKLVSDAQAGAGLTEVPDVMEVYQRQNPTPYQQQVVIPDIEAHLTTAREDADRANTAVGELNNLEAMIRDAMAKGQDVTGPSAAFAQEWRALLNDAFGFDPGTLNTKQAIQASVRRLLPVLERTPGQVTNWESQQIIGQIGEASTTEEAMLMSINFVKKQMLRQRAYYQGISKANSIAEHRAFREDWQRRVEAGDPDTQPLFFKTDFKPENLVEAYRRGMITENTPIFHPRTRQPITGEARSQFFSYLENLAGE